MRAALERVGWLVIGLLIGSLVTHSTTVLAEDSIPTTKVISDGNMTTTVKSPPPSAISPQFSAGNGSDLCTVGASGAVQTQILGISMGTTFTEENCLRLKNSKFLYDSGMKVAAVSLVWHDKNALDAMMPAGTPCPYNGVIGDAAQLAWNTYTDKNPETSE